MADYGFTWNADKTKVTLGSDVTNFTGESYPTVKIIDSSSTKSTVRIYDNKLNNVIYTGTGNNYLTLHFGGVDTVYLGNGKDTVYFGQNHAIIYNFDVTKDRLLSLYETSPEYMKYLSYSTSGNDIIITDNTYQSTVTLKNGNVSAIKDYLSNTKGISQKKMQVVWNTDRTVATLTSDFDTKFKSVDPSYPDEIRETLAFLGSTLSTLKTIDARAVNKEVHLYGSSSDNVIYSGSGGGIVSGGGGNDTIYLGAGSDIVSWLPTYVDDYVTEGNTVVYNFNSSQDILMLALSDEAIQNAQNLGAVITKEDYSYDRLSYKASGNDIIITCSRKDCNNTLTLKGANNQATINYLDSQGIRGENGSTTTWNSDKTSVTLKSNYKDATFNASSTSTLKTIDAKNVSSKITIVGNSLANTITTGSAGSTITGGKGNDTIYAGAGSDVIQYAKGDGNDTIYNFANNDKIKFTSDSLKSIAAASTGTDVVLTTANGGKMTLKTATGKTLNIVNSTGTTTKYVLGRNDANNTFTWASGVRFIGAGKADTLNVNAAGATVDLTNTTLYKSIDAVNASKATKAVTIKGGATKATITGSSYEDTLTGDNAGGTVNGGAGNDTITAGSKGNIINGGAGNDTIKAGAGTDTILISTGMGTDTVTGFSTSDRVKVSSGTLTSIAASATGTDVVVTAGTGKVILKGMVGKNVQVMDTAGKITKYMVGRNDANNTFTWVNGVRYIGGAKTDTLNVNTAGGTVDLTNTAAYKSINAVNAGKATKAVTIKGGSQAVNITGSNYNDTIKAGSKGGTITGGKGNDTITAGAGTDTIVIADGMGTDTITGFAAADKIKVTSASYSLSASGSDVVVTAGTGKAVIKSGIGKNIQVVDKNGTTTKYLVGKKDTANTFTWASGMNYVGSSKTDTVNVNTGGANADLSKSVSINNINASKATKAVTIKGGAFASTITGSAYADKITAGSKGDTIRAGKGNDTIYAGAGTDTIQYAKGEGSDTIYNLSSSDKIKFVSDSLKSIAAASTGTDVVITTANGGKMTLKAATGKTVNVVNSAGTTTKYVLGRNDANNTFTWASGVRFIGTGKTDTLNVNTAGGTVDLTNTTMYKSIDAVNASKATKAVTIKGGAQKVNITGSAYADTLTGANVAGGTVSGGAGNDTIKAGSKGGTLIGGKGNDKIYAGAGADIIKFAAGDGNDTIYNYSNSADTIRLTSGSVSSYKVVNGNGVITTNNGTITLNGYTGKSVYVTDSNGVKRTYSTGSTVPPKLPIGLTASNNKLYVSDAYEDIVLDLEDIPGNFKDIDASAYTKIDVLPLNIYGDAQDNIIIAAKSGSIVYGDSGNDTVYFNSGIDVIQWNGNPGEGNCTVYNFDVNKDEWWSIFTSDDINLTYCYSGNDVVVNSSAGISLTFKELKGKNLSFLSDNGVTYSATGRSNYQSTLSCLASSVSATTSSSVMNISATSQITSVGTMMTSTSSQSELSTLKKGYM